MERTVGWIACVSCLLVLFALRLVDHHLAAGAHAAHVAAGGTTPPEEFLFITGLWNTGWWLLAAAAGWFGFLRDREEIDFAEIQRRFGRTREA